jgi:esterase/lipase
MKFYEDRYNFSNKEELCFKDIVITPVNITYHPVRPGQNIFISLAKVFGKNLPDRVEEELEIEGGLLLSKTDISIHFGKAIGLNEYLDNLLPITNSLFPFIDEVKRSDWIVSYLKSKLTRRFMDDIYTRVAVNIDHLFAVCLRYQKSATITEDQLKTMIYLVAQKLRVREDRRIHPSLSSHSLLRLISDHYHEAFENVVNLAIKEGAIRKQGQEITIRPTALRRKFGFHRIRLRNLISVFANEVEPLKYLIQNVKELASTPPKKLRLQLMDMIKKEDMDIYLEDHHNFRSENSKPKGQGAPIWLRNPKSELGVILVHGYLASPFEMKPLADFLQKKGVNVYVVRLRGHGTSPHQLGQIDLDDWVDSFDRGYTVIRHHCKNIIVGGFSAGGLMALLAAANKSDDIQGAFCINAALQLKDIRTKFIPTVTAWNDLLDKFKIDMGKFEYVENESENPEVNYNQNYLKGVKVLEKLISRCKSRLDHVIAPTLIIQAMGDPVVNPKSAQIIYDQIMSDDKEIFELDEAKHIVVKEENQLVFDKIYEFIERVRSSSMANHVLTKNEGVELDSLNLG